GRTHPTIAAFDVEVTVTGLDPRRTVDGRAVVIVVPTILDPLPYITDHIVESEVIGRKRANRGRLFAIPSAAAAVAIGIVLADAVTPGINCLRPGPRCIFVFSFGQQSIAFSGHL